MSDQSTNATEPAGSGQLPDRVTYFDRSGKTVEVTTLVPVASCPRCGGKAIVELTLRQRLEQPDDTTHVCHPLLGGCNHGFTDSRTRAPSTRDLIDQLGAAVRRHDEIAADAARASTQGDGNDPQIIEGQRADGDDPLVTMGAQSHDLPTIEEIPPSLRSRISDQVSDALQILRTTGVGPLDSVTIARDDVDAIDKRLVNALELLKRGVR